MILHELQLQYDPGDIEDMKELQNIFSKYLPYPSDAEALTH